MLLIYNFKTWIENVVWWDSTRKRVVTLFCVCAAASLIIHVPISELHAQWHYSMSLSSQRFLLLLTYGNSCFIIIRQNFFPVSFSSRIMQLKLSYDGVDRHFFSNSRLCACIVKCHLRVFEMCLHENKTKRMDFLL